jgi:hypothetical protein
MMPQRQLVLFSDRTLLEGIHGTWYYHLSDASGQRALCGDEVMPTGIPETAWGVRTEHLKERYCTRCAKIRQEA